MSELKTQIIHEVVIPVQSRSEVFEVYPLGDLHIGAKNCAEAPLRRTIREIAANPRALWFGGGDMIEAIVPSDAKRFDHTVLPDWMCKPDKGLTVQERLNDVVGQEIGRAIDLLEPIASKCIGLIEGNHEYELNKRSNRDALRVIADALGAKKMPCEAFWRLKFNRKGSSAKIIHLYAHHGWGGGRTPGAEPNKLAATVNEWEDADICFRGHSHCFAINPPKAVMWIPKHGRLPEEFYVKHRYGANWGCWVYSHRSGSSTYASRAGYPARPMLTVKAVIKPFVHTQVNHGDVTMPEIELRERTL